MSYCVNCGVELDDSAKRCALCQTEVINPNKKENKEAVPPFSSEEHIPESMKKRFVAYMVSMVMLIPNIVCLLINIVFPKVGFWAFYVNTTSLLLWVVFVFPFFTKKLLPYLMWFVDTVGASAYVYFFFAMSENRTIAKWYPQCALPIILMVSFMVLVYMFWVKAKKRHWVLRLIAIIGDIGIGSLFGGFLLDRTATVKFATEIGLIVFVCCAVLGLFLLYCYKSENMRKWLSKRFFV